MRLIWIKTYTIILREYKKNEGEERTIVKTQLLTCGKLQRSKLKLNSKLI